jgi:hypothetical protein
MHTTCKEVLAVLRQFMDDVGVADEEKGTLWAVLTALRGPDVPDEEAKLATTGVIREEVFGGKLARWVGAIHGPDTASYQETRRDLAVANGNWSGHSRLTRHFYNHAKRAFDALGLMF